MAQDPVGPLLLAPYGAAREMPESEFQDHALGLIKPALGFESALWGTGTTDCESIVPLSAHLYEVDPEALAEWKAINGHDPAVANTLKVWGDAVQYHVPTLFSTVEDSAARDYARRWKRRYFLATAEHNESADGLQWMSLYRFRDQPFSEDQRLLCQAVMPHFAEALRINRALGVARAVDALGAIDSIRALALADMRGNLRHIQQRFSALLGLEWREIEASRLPPPLARAVADPSADSFVGRLIRLRIRRAGDLVMLEADLKTAIDALSPQRARVARLFAQGYTYKAIARELRLQPTTIRNHLAAAYRELGITDRQQLKRLDSTPLTATGTQAPHSRAQAAIGARTVASAA